MSIEPGIPSNHLILCRPLLLLPSTFPSIRVFSNELAFHIRWAEYMSFRFSINPSNEYSALIPFRIDWFDLLDQICTYTWFTLLYSRNNIIKQVYSNKVDLKKKQNYSWTYLSVKSFTRFYNRQLLNWLPVVPNFWGFCYMYNPLPLGIVWTWCSDSFLTDTIWQEWWDTTC